MCPERFRSSRDVINSCGRAEPRARERGTAVRVVGVFGGFRAQRASESRLSLGPDGRLVPAKLQFLSSSAISLPLSNFSSLSFFLEIKRERQIRRLGEKERERERGRNKARKSTNGNITGQSIADGIAGDGPERG